MATPPTRVTTAASAWNTTTSPKTASLSSLLTGDRVLMLLAAADANTGSTSLTPTTTVGTSSAWSVLVNVGVGGVSARVYIATVTITADSPTFTASMATVTATVNWGFRLVAYRNHGGIGVNVGSKVISSPSTDTMDCTFTTTGDNSAIEVVAGDWSANATSPVNTTDEREVQAGNEVTTVEYPGDGTTYGAFTGVYADAGLAGSKTVGWSLTRAPGIGAVEILGTNTAPPNRLKRWRY